MKYLIVDGIGYICLEHDIIFDEHEGDVIVIPKHFVSDGGSIPRILWSLLGDGRDRYLPAYLLHDWLYSIDCPYDITKKHSDQLLYQYLRILGCNWLKAQTIYSGVALFGNKHFRVQHFRVQPGGAVDWTRFYD